MSMTEAHSGPRSSDQQALEAFTDGLREGAMMMGNALADTTGVHSTSELGKPNTSVFGESTHRWDYPDGKVRPLDELTEPGSPVTEFRLIVARPDGRSLAVMIGKTPPAWDSREPGGKAIVDAGQPGDLLMVLAHENEEPKYFYLDPESLQQHSGSGMKNLVVAEGGPVPLLARKSTGRGFQISGTVERAYSLVALR